jgi:hypothetical protein
MQTLYERLLRICREQGIDAAPGRAIRILTGLSSGRVTQIKDAGEAARLGDQALRRIARLGYRADWIQEGRLPERSTEPAPSQHIAMESIARYATERTGWPFARIGWERFMRLPEIERAVIEGQLLQAVNDAEARLSKQRAPGKLSK